MGQPIDFWAVAMTARTLQEAHEALSRLEPPPNATTTTKRDYHLRSEALYWAGREQRKAKEQLIR